MPPATRMSASWRRTSVSISSASGSAPPWLRTRRWTPRADQLLDERVEGRRRAAPPRERREAIRPRVEADREPVAGDREAAGERVGPLDDRDREHDPRGPRGEREPHVVGLLEAARDLERDRDPRRDRADGLEVGRRCPLGAVEVDEVEDPRALGDELLGDAIGPVGRRADAGRRARPVHDPRAPCLDVDRRDDVHPSSPRPAAGGGGS